MAGAGSESNKRPLLLRASVFAACAGAAVAAGVFRQQPRLNAQIVTYQPHDPIVTPPPQGFFSVPASNCSLTDAQGQPIDGGFVKKNTVLQVDASNTAAPITGPLACDWYVFGVYNKTTPRYLTSLYVRKLNTLDYYNFFAPYQVYSYDSRPTAGHMPSAMSTVGSFQFDFQTRAEPTNCNLPTASDWSSMTVNVTACKPVWWRLGDISTVHLPQTTIKVYIDQNTLLGAVLMSGAAWAAETQLNGSLAGTGVSVQIVNSDCGFGSDCVKVSSTTGIVDGCADFTPTSIVTQTGLITAYSDLRLGEEYWPYATQERLQRTLAHELEHGLSLHHNSCSLGDSVMSMPSVPGDFPTMYAACTQATGMALSPTPTDSLPTKSTYTNQVRAVCGF